MLHAHTCIHALAACAINCFFLFSSSHQNQSIPVPNTMNDVTIEIISSITHATSTSTTTTTAEPPPQKKMPPIKNQKHQQHRLFRHTNQPTNHTLLLHSIKWTNTMCMIIGGTIIIYCRHNIICVCVCAVPTTTVSGSGGFKRRQ